MGNYIFGAGKIGAKIKKTMLEYNETLDGYIDSYKNGEYEGEKIVDISLVDQESNVIISVLNTNSIIEIYHSLRNAGIKKIYWYFDAYKKGSKGENDFFKEQCLNLSGWGELIMPHVELHISDKCNLNCKGCSHFSPLYSDLNASFDKKMNDVRSLKKLFDNIFRIDILGGEPLLNPELKQYVEALRTELPETFIQIYTNGLLVPKLKDDVLKAIYENNICISISEYRPTHNMIENIKHRLDGYNIRYHIAAYDEKQKFNIPISTSDNSKYPRLCISDGCITVSDGKISRCPTLMYIERFNEYFHQNLPTEGIYMINEYSDGYRLLEDMKKEVPLCNHCIKCDIDWSVCENEKRIEDFAIDE